MKWQKIIVSKIEFLPLHSSSKRCLKSISTFFYSSQYLFICFDVSINMWVYIQIHYLESIYFPQAIKADFDFQVICQNNQTKCIQIQILLCLLNQVLMYYPKQILICSQKGYDTAIKQKHLVKTMASEEFTVTQLPL